MSVYLRLLIDTHYICFLAGKSVHN